MDGDEDLHPHPSSGTMRVAGNSVGGWGMNTLLVIYGLRIYEAVCVYMRGVLKFNERQAPTHNPSSFIGTGVGFGMRPDCVREHRLDSDWHCCLC